MLLVACHTSCWQHIPMHVIARAKQCCSCACALHAPVCIISWQTSKICSSAQHAATRRHQACNPLIALARLTADEQQLSTSALLLSGPDRCHWASAVSRAGSSICFAPTRYCWQCSLASGAYDLWPRPGVVTDSCQSIRGNTQGCFWWQHGMPAGCHMQHSVHQGPC